MKRFGLLLLGVILVPVASGCHTTSTGEGAVLGTALGAGLGALIGHQSGHQGEGALIGAGLGAISGAVIGDAVGDPVPRNRQVVYRETYEAPPQPVNRTGRVERVENGHYEVEVVRTPSGETYERRVWVPDAY